MYRQYILYIAHIMCRRAPSSARLSCRQVPCELQREPLRRRLVSAMAATQRAWPHRTQTTRPVGTVQALSSPAASSVFTLPPCATSSRPPSCTAGKTRTRTPNAPFAATACGASIFADPDPTRCKWDGLASTTPGTPSKSAADFARAATAGSQSGFDIVSAPVIRQENGPCAVRL